ncbi:MAG: lectin-like protein [Phycisphaerae bacterium]
MSLVSRTRTALITTSLACSSVLAQPANDACTSAEALSGFGTYGFNLNGSSTDGLADGLCLFAGQSQIENDVWYCWTAPESGPVVARTCGLTTLDTRIAIYDGCSCPTGSAILACNDDACGLQTIASFVAVSGQSYLVRVGLYDALDPNDPNGTTAGSFEMASALPAIVHGPVVRAETGSSYYLTAVANWSFSRARAQNLGGDLVTINDFDENEFIRTQVLQFDGADRRGWIGLTDQAAEGDFRWLTGEPVTFTNWSGGEPNNSGGVEDVVEMFGNGLWNDNREVPTAQVFGLVEVPAPAICPGDVDGDNDVDLTDLATLLSNFGVPSGATREQGDLDGDGDVDLTDLATLLANFGLTCA